MNLGVQYYRAPFPNEKYWADDFTRIADSGFNTVQLWVLWAWVESKPGVFRFDDYDRLIELAERKGLGVVLSTKAEIQPHWIHREVPGSEMIDHMGRAVVSSQRLECHFGLTPGGCTDHPGVWERMARFLAETATRYKDVPNLRGWDAWNELRWNVHADGYVCYCDSTLQEYRNWLGVKYGGLDGLNDAWQRRYGVWEEVMPGKMPVRPFTEMMTFQHFLTWRANQHGKARCEQIRRVDPNHPVTVHAASPCPLEPGGIASSNQHLIEYNQAVNRGNDWFFADDLEGIGCSSFPKWGKQDDTDFAVRMTMIHSAARGKKLWLSELQGSAAMTENIITPAVNAREQQRWLWQGLSRGADTILFWCWRDEVFGREAGGFGIAGNDGFAEERLTAMNRTSRILSALPGLPENLRLDKAGVGVFFSPQSYYLNWCQEGNGDLAMQSVQNYCRALSRALIPHVVVEEEHLDVLEGLKVLFMPRVLVLDEPAERAIETFVRAGGILFTESEVGAWTSTGIWRYPQERLVARITGLAEKGRRMLNRQSSPVYIEGRVLQVALAQWMTPVPADAGIVIAPCEDAGKPASLLSRVPVGAGAVYVGGSFFGNAAHGPAARTFGAMVDFVTRDAGVRSPVEVIHPRDIDRDFQVVSGKLDGKQVLFIFAPEGVGVMELRLREGLFQPPGIRELLTGAEIKLGADGRNAVINLDPATWGIVILCES